MKSEKKGKGKIKRIILISITTLIICILLISTQVVSLFGNSNRNLSPKVTFLQEEPIIDGILDKKLSYIPFNKFDSKLNIHFLKGSLNSQYKIAYGTNFLYLYIEAEADSFICRDRGYQNGDGFILNISKPKPENKPTDEFYEFGFSAQKDKKQMWAEKVLWTYNMTVILSTLDENVKIKYKAIDGKIGFELLLPWESVYPYHPWISEKIGINLWFIKAFPNKSFPNAQGMILDLGFGRSKKKYKLLEFEKPTITDHSQAYMVLNKNHCKRGDTIKLNIATLAPKSSTRKCYIELTDISDKTVLYDSVTIHTEKGVSFSKYKMVTNNFVSGDYTVKLLSPRNKIVKSTVSIMPDYDFVSWDNKLDELKTRISSGTYSTIKFSLKDIKKRENKLYDYETCSVLNKEIINLSIILDSLETGVDIIESKTGEFRRGFLSAIDSSYQPYTVKIPDNYNPKQSYPLIVFLHGSGRTDKNTFKYHSYLSKGNFIQIAPKARGTNNYYGTPESQIDIQEAIADAIKNYSIDTTNIILAGFSMGGYGVYRTFYENPDKYKALAVFSGEPKVSFWAKTKGGDYPNFLKTKHIKHFTEIPIFVYHGKKDLNCPYQQIQEFVEKLKKLGGHVTFVNEDMGHGILSDEKKMNVYYEWLGKIIK